MIMEGFKLYRSNFDNSEFYRAYLTAVIHLHPDSSWSITLQYNHNWGNFSFSTMTCWFALSGKGKTIYQRFGDADVDLDVGETSPLLCIMAINRVSSNLAPSDTSDDFFLQHVPRDVMDLDPKFIVFVVF